MRYNMLIYGTVVNPPLLFNLLDNQLVYFSMNCDIAELSNLFTPPIFGGRFAYFAKNAINRDVHEALLTFNSFFCQQPMSRLT